MKWNKDYFYLFITAKKNLNIKNLDKLSKVEIEHLNNKYKYKIEIFESYKKYIFFKWIDQNYKNTISFISKVNKLIHKYEFKFNEFELQKIRKFEPREFTERRILKTIETPYFGLDGTKLLSPFFYFYFSNVRTYKEKYPFLRKQFQSEMYLSNKEIVLFDKENQKILKIFFFEKLKEISLKKSGITIIFKNEKYVFRNIDFDQIYIALKRITTKFKIKYSKNDEFNFNFVEEFLFKLY